MARDHAQIRLDMWGDDDWRKLTVPAQHLYMLLLTSPSLSLCGVADWRPARIAPLAAEWTTEDVRDAARELADGLFLVLDEDTEEVLIRSFVRHDGLMKSPNMATAMATAHAGIASTTLRGVVVHELRRLRDKQPDLAGWRSTRALAVLDREAIDPSGMGSAAPSGNPSGNPSQNPSVKGSGNPEPKGSGNPCPTPTPTPAPTPSSSNEEEKNSSSPNGEGAFERFYAAYPRKAGRKDAEKAFAKAARTVDPETLVTAAKRYAADPNQPVDRSKIPYPATWLNKGRWDDEPLPVRLDDATKALPPVGEMLPGSVVDGVLGVDYWSPPAPPEHMDRDEGWEWQRQQQLKRIAERQAAARARMGRSA